MKKLILFVALTLSIVGGAAGAQLVSDTAPVANAGKAGSIIPIGTDFRCFLCGSNGCAVTNVGGSGCDESPDWCEVVNWGCADWPSGGFIAIRW